MMLLTTSTIALNGMYFLKKVRSAKNLCHRQRMYFVEDIASGLVKLMKQTRIWYMEYTFAENYWWSFKANEFRERDLATLH